MRRLKSGMKRVVGQVVTSLRRERTGTVVLAVGVLLGLYWLNGQLTAPLSRVREVAVADMAQLLPPNEALVFAILAAAAQFGLQLFLLLPLASLGWRKVILQDLFLARELDKTPPWQEPRCWYRRIFSELPAEALRDWRNSRQQQGVC